MVTPAGLTDDSEAADRFDAVWDTTKLPDGPVTIFVRATDRDGAQTTAQLTVTIESACSERSTVVQDDGCCPGRALDSELDSDCASGAVDIPGAAALSAPAASDGTVWVVRVDASSVAALVSLTSHEVGVEMTLPSAVSDLVAGAPVVEPGGDVLVASDSGLCRVSPPNALRWSCDVGGGPAAAPVPLADGRIAFAGADDQLTIFTESGAVGGAATLGSPASDLISDASAGRLYVAHVGGALSAWDVGEGPVLAWSSASAGVASPLSHDGSNRVLFGRVGGGIRVMKDLGTQGSPSDFELPGAASVEVVTLQSEVAAGTAGGQPVVVSLQLGGPVELETDDAPTPVTGAGVFSETRRLYFPTETGLVGYAAGTSRWEVVWRWSGAQSPTGLTLLADGRIVLVTSSGRVHFVTPGHGGPAEDGWPVPRRNPARTAGLH